MKIIIAQHSCKKYSTPSHEAGTKYTKKKNYNSLNLPLCSLWFLGAFVFKDFVTIQRREPRGRWEA